MQYRQMPCKRGFYQSNLNFTEEVYADIIKEIYAMEKAENNPYTANSRTFHLHKGFHSCNLFEGDILEKYTHLGLAVNRIQEILYNQFSTNNINFTKDPSTYLKITEIWFNILRKGDANMPHNHPNCHISGNFYLKVPAESDRLHNLEGSLVFIKADNHNFYLPKSIGSEETSAVVIRPKVGQGVLFQSYMKHVVMSHFSEEDRIGLAFNAVCYAAPGLYRSLKPTPYWMPGRLWIKTGETERIIKGGEGEKRKLAIKFPNEKEIEISVPDTFELKPKMTVKIGFETLKNVANEQNYLPYAKKCFTQDDYFSSDHQLTEKWSKDDAFYYEPGSGRAEQNTQLLIVFAGFGLQDKDPTFIFVKSLSRYNNYDKLFVRDATKLWYLRNRKLGSNGIKSGPVEVCQRLRQYILPRHETVCTLGSSAGAFAALLFGHMLGAQKCLAFAPQTTLIPGQRAKDPRWADKCDTVSKMFRSKKEQKYLDLQRSLAGTTMQICIYASHPLDVLAAKRVTDTVGGAELVQVEAESHLTALVLKKLGKLQKILEKGWVLLTLVPLTSSS